MGERNGSARDGVDEGRVVWETWLGGEVVSEDGIGRSKLHRWVGRVVDGHLGCAVLWRCVWAQPE